MDNEKPQSKNINRNHESSNNQNINKDIHNAACDVDKLSKMNTNNNNKHNNNNSNINPSDTDDLYFSALLGAPETDISSRMVGFSAAQTSAPFMNCANREFVPDSFLPTMYERQTASSSSSSSAPQSPSGSSHHFPSAASYKATESGCEMMMVSGQIPEGMMGMSSTSGDVSIDEMGYSWFGKKKGTSLSSNRESEIVSPGVGIIQHHQQHQQQQQHLQQQHQQPQHCIIPGMAMLSSCKFLKP